MSLPLNSNNPALRPEAHTPHHSEQQPPPKQDETRDMFLNFEPSTPDTKSTSVSASLHHGHHTWDTLLQIKQQQQQQVYPSMQHSGYVG